MLGGTLATATVASSDEDEDAGSKLSAVGLRGVDSDDDWGKH